MKHALALLFTALGCIGMAGTITYTVPGTAGSSVTVAGLRSADGSPMTVDFGDGTTDTLVSSGRVVHTYAAASSSITVSGVDAIGGKMGPDGAGGQVGGRMASLSSGTKCTSVMMSGITAIRDFSFYGFESLTSVTVPEGCKSIGRNAFGRCSKLVTLSLPSTLERVGANCITHCNAMTTINLAAGNARFGKIGTTAITYDMPTKGIVVVLATTMPSGYKTYLHGNIATLTTAHVPDTSCIEVCPCLVGIYNNDPDWSPYVRAAQFASVTSRPGEDGIEVYGVDGWSYASKGGHGYVIGDDVDWIDFDWDYCRRDAW